MSGANSADADALTDGAYPRDPIRVRSHSQPTTHIAWTPDRLWAALRTDDKRQLAARLGRCPSNVYARIRCFRASRPGGNEPRLFADRDVHRHMSAMLRAARFEVLTAVAFVSLHPPPVFNHLLAAARRGVRVRLLFRSDNMAGSLIDQLQADNVDFRTLPDLHAKFLITDTTALVGSANFTQASADRASEVAAFLADPSLVHDLREVFLAYWGRARPF